MYEVPVHVTGCKPYLLNVPNPVPDVVKGFLVGDVIDQHDALSGGRQTRALHKLRAEGEAPSKVGWLGRTPTGQPSHKLPPLHPCGPSFCWTAAPAPRRSQALVLSA